MSKYNVQKGGEMNQRLMEEFLEILLPFSEEAKFCKGGPGYLMEKDWKDFRKVYLKVVEEWEKNES